MSNNILPPFLRDHIKRKLEKRQSESESESKSDSDSGSKSQIHYPPKFIRPVNVNEIKVPEMEESGDLVIPEEEEDVMISGIENLKLEDIIRNPQLFIIPERKRTNISFPRVRRKSSDLSENISYDSSDETKEEPLSPSSQRKSIELPDLRYYAIRSPYKAFGSPMSPSLGRVSTFDKFKRLFSPRKSSSSPRWKSPL